MLRDFPVPVVLMKMKMKKKMREYPTVRLNESRTQIFINSFIQHLWSTYFDSEVKFLLLVYSVCVCV